MALAEGDAGTLEAVYRAYRPALMSYLIRLVGRDEAEDVLQRTFLDVWRHAGREEYGQHLSGWLFTIAHHRAVDVIRKRRAQAVDVDTLAGLVGEDGREMADRYVAAAEVRGALRRLAEHERRVLELTYFADLTQREIATRLDVPLGTVKARSSRGMHHLAALLAARHEGPASDRPVPQPGYVPGRHPSPRKDRS